MVGRESMPLWVVIIIGVSLMYHNQTYTVQFISLHFHIQYMYALVRVGV